MAPAGGLPQQVLTPLRASFWINRFLPVLLAPPFMSDPRVLPVVVNTLQSEGGDRCLESSVPGGR